jgi:two-component system phosphate regulon sensor histidine kinase PhoR
MKTIRSKIGLTYILLALGLAGILGVLSSAALERFFRDRITDELKDRTELFTVILGREAERDSSSHDLYAYIRQMSVKDKVRITVIDSTGTVLAESNLNEVEIPGMENHLSRPEVQEALLKGIGVNIRKSTTVKTEMLYVAKRVSFSLLLNGRARNVRFVRLAVPLTELQAAIDHIRFLILIVCLAALVVVVGLSIFVSRTITKPINKTARAVKEIQAGNLEMRVKVKSKDEVGQLADAINSMVERLSQDMVQLRKLEKVRSQFLANVSHELRTPVFSIQGFLETLLDGAVDDPNVSRDFLEKAHKHTIRLNNLLNDLIEISRIESGEMKMSFRYFKIENLLRQVVDEMKPEAGKKGINLRYNENNIKDVEVLGDKERLKQALINLIDNALKYTDDGGKVDVYFEDGEQFIKVLVKDTGCGISQEHLPRIFERFYRVDKDRSREVGGTGLGLAIVKHIVEAHKGELIVESEPKKGSTFGFTLKK